MPQVFISYRRQDTIQDADSLAKELRALLGSDAVFIDRSNLKAGDLFANVLDGRIDSATHVIVLIGPSWLTSLQERAQASEPDFVQFEVARALERRGQGKCLVMPVMVRGAQLPKKEDLLAEQPNLSWLAPLWDSNFHTLHGDRTWDDGVRDLAQDIGLPYQWGKLALRAACVMVASLLAAFALQRTLDVLQARNLILALMACYATAEVVAGVLGKGR